MSDLINGLRHMADDHACCEATILHAIDELESMGRANAALRQSLTELSRENIEYRHKLERENAELLQKAQQLEAKNARLVECVNEAGWSEVNMDTEWGIRCLELQREVREQARLLGRGSEREAALLAKVERLERENAALRELINEPYQFFSFGHRALEPWGQALTQWCERAEELGFKKEVGP